MLIHCILLTKSNYFNVHSKPNLSKNKHFMTRKPQESLQTTLYIILPFLYFQAPRSTLDRIANRFVNYLPGDTDKKQNQSDRQRALTQSPLPLLFFPHCYERPSRASSTRQMKLRAVYYFPLL